MGFQLNFTDLTDIYPNPQLMSNNQTFQEWALKEWQEKRRGLFP